MTPGGSGDGDPRANPPGRGTLSWRLGTRADFLERMLLRVRSQAAGGGPTLLPLGTNPRQDLTLALLDAWASVADVMSFYQERRLNEAYLGTATEELSILELTGTIGVRPQPPLSARADLAFTIQAQARGPAEVTVPKGTAVQSLPGADGMPQVFETSAALVARAEWNAMQLRVEADDPGATPGDSGLRADAVALVVAGGRAGIRPGTALLLTGRTEAGAAWAALKTVRRVGRSAQRNLTLLAWDEPLDPALGSQRLLDVKAAAAGDPVPLFGADAAEWKTLKLEVQARYSELVGGLRRFDPPGPWRSLEHGGALGKVLSVLALEQGALLAGVEGQGLMRSVDGGATWVQTRGPLARADVSCLALDPLGRVLAGTTQRGVFRSSDGGENWTALQGALRVEGSGDKRKLAQTRLPSSPVRCLKAFETGAGASAATYVLAGTDAGVFCWNEATAAWGPFNLGLPGVKDATQPAGISVRAVAAHDAPERYYLGTDQGVFTTERLGKPWQQCDPAAAGRSVSALAVDERGTLYVALEGGGLFSSTDGGRRYRELDPGRDASGAPRAVALLLPRTSGRGSGMVWAVTRDAFLRSLDGGTTWEVIDDGPGAQEATALAPTPTGGVIAATKHAGVKDAQWPGWALADGQLELGQPVPGLSPGVPLVLEQPEGDKGDKVRRRFLRVAGASPVQLSGFGLRRRVTRLEVDSAVDLSGFDRRQALVRLGQQEVPLHGQQVRQGELLADPDQDLDAVLAGEGAAAITRKPPSLEDAPLQRLVLEGVLPDPGERAVLISGRRLRAQVRPGASLILTTEDGLARVPLEPGQTLEVLARPRELGDRRREWSLRTGLGVEGTVIAGSNELALLPAAGDADPVVERSRVVTFSALANATAITLEGPLRSVFDPGTVVVQGNVVEATHGASLSEVLGSGDSSAVNQRFQLKRAPLTWLATAAGPAPELEIWVSERRWERVEDWSGQDGHGHVYVLEADETGATTVCFGDGERGARLPTGQENVTARYRCGAGPAGNVEANRIHMIRQRTPGLKAVTNPLPASGGIAQEPAGELRLRAPLGVRTLGRIVSLGDFEDFVRDYPGVARARARSVWGGRRQTVFITVATTDADAGHLLVPGSSLELALRQALERFHPRSRAVELGSFERVMFDVEATLVVERGQDPDKVEARARAALVSGYGFDKRELTAPVTTSGIIRTLTALPGVRNVYGLTLRLQEGGAAVEVTGPVLRAADARWDERAGQLRPAQLLELNAEAGVTLHVEVEP